SITKCIFTLYSWQSRRTTTDAILVFCLVTGIMVTTGVILAMTFMILHWICPLVEKIIESCFMSFIKFLPAHLHT
uniref:Uncharacterized protein n=1 Tax=Athene cunicularia TaxID=194338 RepID=A0A663LIY8_ATHCN